ncbi:hypothetical protein SO802_012201 [Lithocarpus litseifolius]|uniref:Aminotransferase-like plant mobile domain-containing protein n=1 Tax=Lithocarpus litseifolius TaxID=425828 RepID=A0AAW2D5L9_9ROSI
MYGCHIVFLVDSKGPAELADLWEPPGNRVSETRFLISMAAANVGQIDHAQPGPIDGSVLTQQPNHRSEAIWNGQVNVCWDFLDFQLVNNEQKKLDGQRILIKRLLEQVVDPLPPNAEEDQVHKYARCYILALPGDTIFVDKSGNRLHLMWVQQLEDLRNPRRWLWVPNKKNRPTHIFLKRYHEQIASMLPGQVAWQPYEAELEDLLPWCVAGRAVWTTSVPLVCFRLIEKHTPDRVVHQFGMIQEVHRAVNTDTVLHGIDLRGKVGVDLTQRHAEHIREWGNRLQQCCEAVLGDMPLAYEYFNWFKRVTRRFIDVPGARLILMEIGRVQPPIPKAPNEEAATPATAPTQRPSTTESPSTSTVPAESHSRPLVATPRVVHTPNPSPSTLHPSLSPTIPSPTPHPPPPPTIRPPTPHPCPGSDIRPLTPRSFPELSPILSFDLGIDPTPPDMHTEPPSHSTSIGPSSGINLPHVQAKQAIGLPAEPAGRPKRISRAPPYGTRGHKHGHKARPEASDKGHARPPPYYTR